MCGRYAITLPPDTVRAWFGYAEQPNFPPRFNIAPTQPIPIVCRGPMAPEGNDRQFRLVRWGLLPPFVKDPASFPLLLNARAEGVEDKPSFRAAMIRRRCLVIADGYYEWRRSAPRGPGTPYLIRRRDGAPLGLAGLWESWMGADGSELDTGCIITTDACATTAAIHPRMPAMVSRADYTAWLNGDDVSPAQALRLLRPPGPDDLEVREIGSLINKVAHDEPAVQHAVAPQHVPAAVSRQGSLF